jgi:hypothetical protein
MMNPHAGMPTGLTQSAPSPQQAPAGPLGSWNNPFTLSGILEDPSQLNQLNQNPMWQFGMGLLASTYDANVNPFTAMQQGLSASQGFQNEAEQRETLEAQRKMLEDFFKAQTDELNRQRTLSGTRTGEQPRTAFETAVSPSVRRGLGSAALTGQNEDLYRRMAWREILGK